MTAGSSTAFGSAAVEDEQFDGDVSRLAPSFVQRQLGGVEHILANADAEWYRDHDLYCARTGDPVASSQYQAENDVCDENLFP